MGFHDILNENGIYTEADMNELRKERDTLVHALLELHCSVNTYNGIILKNIDRMIDNDIQLSEEMRDIYHNAETLKWRNEVAGLILEHRKHCYVP